MEPIFTYGELSISLIEIILGIVFTLLGALGALFFSRGRGQQFQQQFRDMAERQIALQGRLSQMAEDSAQREAVLRDSLDNRLSQVSERVGKSLSDNQDRNSQNLKSLHERLALIDRAQKNIETLSGEVSGLQMLLSNKQSRGAFGEKQMQDIIETYMPPRSYSFQVPLSNGKRVDGLIHLPKGQGDVAIDAKFPLESWQRMVESENNAEHETARRDFIRDMQKHIKDIADKYLIHGETYDVALMFLPSEAIYAELHTQFQEIIDKAFLKKVMIVSPTTFMATLHTMRAVMKDATMREQAHIIQKHMSVIGEDVRRLDERVEKLQNHFNLSLKDIDLIRTSAKKITSRSDKISSLELREDEGENIANISDFRGGGS